MRSEFTEPSKSLPVGRTNRPLGAAIPVEHEREEMAEGEVAAAVTDLRIARQIQTRSDAVDSVSELSEEMPQEKEAKVSVGDELAIVAKSAPLQEQDILVSNEREADKSRIVGGFADANNALNDVVAESGADSPSFARARAKRAPADEESAPAVAEGFEVASPNAQREFRSTSSQMAFGVTAGEDLLRKAEAGKKDVPNFDMRDGVWYESGYAGQKTIELERDSRKWRKLLLRYPELESFAVAPEARVFNLDGTWYSLNKIPEAETR